MMGDVVVCIGNPKNHVTREELLMILSIAANYLTVHELSTCPLSFALIKPKAATVGKRDVPSARSDFYAHAMHMESRRDSSGDTWSLPSRDVYD